MNDDDLDRICEDCQRSNCRNACTGRGDHCPLALIDEAMEHPVTSRQIGAILWVVVTLATRNYETRKASLEESGIWVKVTQWGMLQLE
jgi:hypothetical protein